jgi:benzodiazapine receptor
MDLRRSVTPPARQSWLGLAGLVALCFAVAAIGGAVTATSVQTWYPELAKPAFTPPDWLFGPVWTTLYAMMGVGAWLSWRRVGLRHLALRLFFAQLALNLAWSLLFFGLHWIGVALVDILLLLVLIAATTYAFFVIDRRAALLFVPYLLWVGYASLLNGAIWLMN